MNEFEIARCRPQVIMKSANLGEFFATVHPQLTPMFFDKFVQLRFFKQGNSLNLLRRLKLPPERVYDALTILSVGELLSKAIRYTHAEQSVSSLFD